MTMRISSRLPELLAIGAAIALGLLALVDAAPVLRASLAAFLLLIAVPVGALLLLLIHRLTGGHWGEAAAPRLRRAAALLPLAALFVLPALLAPAPVFEWARDPSTVRHPDVARWYLDPAAFMLRTLVTLGLWSAFALLAAHRPERLGKPLAALGLLLFGLTVSTAGVDWVLSLDPRFRSTAFPMSLAVSWLLAGSTLLGHERASGDETDAAKLMATFALGLLYLDAMQFLVAYTGNLPDIAAWYGRRSGAWPTAAILAAFAGAGLAPVLAVLRENWRASHRLRRRVGVCVLAGLAARTLWLVVPEWDAGPAFWAALPLWLLLASTLAILAPRLDRTVQRRGEVTHGA